MILNKTIYYPLKEKGNDHMFLIRILMDQISKLPLVSASKN